MIQHHPRYGLRVSVGPALEPVTIAELKNYLRIDSDITQDDGLISSHITAARLYCEKWTARSFITTTWTFTLDSFFGYELPGGQLLLGNRPLPQQLGGGGVWPYLSVIRFPRDPVIDVPSISYIDPVGATQTYDPSQWVLDVVSMPARLLPQYGTVWPVTREIANAVTITFRAGFGTTPESVPETFRQAIRMKACEMYWNRGDMSSQMNEKPNASMMSLLSIEDSGYLP